VLAGLAEDRQAARDIVDAYGLDLLLLPLRTPQTTAVDVLCSALRSLYHIAADGM
jgi:hypothetical protein